MNKLRRREAALTEGDWYGLKATRVWADIAVAAGMAISAGASAYSASKQGQVANSQLDLMRDQTYKQDQSFSMLQDLMTDPGKFFDNPVYKAAFNQGSSAVAHQNAANFGPNSGSEAGALQTFGQSFGFSQLQQQEQLLAGMSGTQFNPAAAGQAASGAFGAANQDWQQLAGTLSFFGNKGGGGGGGGGTTFFAGDPGGG